jgi:endonuclease/exonuclease/phosphatase (EEP) superfamily protein YafD
MRPVRLLPLLTAIVGVLVVDRGARAEEPARPLRLLTYNVNYANPDVEATLTAIAAVDADVVLLQEITSEWQRALVARFDHVYPHRLFRTHTRAAGGLAVLSKHPVREEELLPSPSWFPAQRLVLTTPMGALQILNVHLRPAIQDGSWVKGYFTTPPVRLREVEAYWPKLAHSLPTIVAGDFNEDPSGSALRFLADRGLARVPTDGPRTWHYVATQHGKTSDVLSIDIDHVLLDRSLVAREARVLDAGTSDHRPVVVTITPKP